MKNYYEILGVPEDVDEKALKQAYRSLAKEWHPDLFSNEPKDKQDAANEKFKEINEAYAVLSDSDQRKQYDYQRQNPQGNYQFNWQDARRRSHNDPLFDDMLRTFMDNFEVFESGNGRTVFINLGGHRKREKENKDITYNLEIYPEMSLKDQEANVDLPRVVFCPECQGEGCRRCRNQGAIETSESRKVKIPKDSVGKKLRLKGMGWQMDPQKPAGDLYLRISLKDSQNFGVLSDYNLQTIVRADPTVAIIGGHGIMSTLDGQQRRVPLPSGLSQGSRVRLGKHGILFNGEKTELIGVVLYEPPSNVLDEDRERLKKYQEGLECQKVPELEGSAND